MTYSDEQRATAARLQQDYRAEMMAAHRKLDEAGKTMSREVDAAQEVRDRALRAAGVDPNHLRDLLRRKCPNGYSYCGVDGMTCAGCGQSE